MMIYMVVEYFSTSNADLVKGKIVAPLDVFLQPLEIFSAGSKTSLFKNNFFAR